MWRVYYLKAVYMLCLVYAMAWLGEPSAFIVKEFISYAGSVISTQ